MGGQQSQEDKDFDAKLQQMQQGQLFQNQQQVQSSLYSQQQEIQQPMFVEGYVENVNKYTLKLQFIKRRVLPQMKSKKTYAVKANGSVLGDSFKLVQDKSYASVFHLTFVFESEVENLVTVYFMATEVLGNNNMILGFNSDQKCITKTCKFSPGKQVAFPYGVSFIDTSQFSQSQLVNASGGKIPIVVNFKPTNQQDQRQTFYYLSLMGAQGKYKPKLIQTKFMSNGQVYIMDNVYGISDSKFNKDGKEKKECSICLTDFVDTILFPCKHMCVCHMCAKDLQQRSQNCPLCRQTIESFLKLEDNQDQQQQQQPQQPQIQNMQQQYPLQQF